MKIDYVIDALQTESAGTESQLRLLITGMLARGHEVRLFVLRHTDYSRHCDYPCEIISVGFKSFYSPSSWWHAWQFRRRLQRDHTQVLHGFFNDVALLIPLLLSFSSVKNFTSRRDMGIWYTPANLAILRINAFTRCQVIANSQAVANHARAQEKIPARKVSCIFNALDHASQNAVPAETARLKAQLDAISATKICLVANIKPLKQIETLVEAAKLLKSRQVDNVRYYVIGAVADAAYADSLQRLIEQHALQDQFTLTGPIAAVRTILSAFDIGVLSSGSEGLSNTVIEYLNGGLPAVTSNSGGNPEVVSDGVNGFLFTPGDAPRLAEILQQLSEDPDLRQTIGQRAQQSAAAFTVESMCEQYEQIYRDA